METHQANESVRSILLKTYLIVEVSNSVTEDLKLAFDYRGLTGLYPRLNGWNTYAPARPCLVKRTLCENWSGRHIGPRT